MQHQQQHTPEQHHYMDPLPEDQTSCASCMKDIPRSAAKSAEASGYTLYFCGTDCYSEWNRQAERAHLKEPGEHQTR